MAWEHRPGRPLVFNHIPKTAGTSLSEALADAIRPARTAQGLDGSVFGSFEGAGSIRRRVRRLVITGPEQIPADTQLVTGHIAPSTTLARFPDAPHVTVLREPRTRVLSLWLYARTRPAHWSRAWGEYGDRILLARDPLLDYLTNPRAALGVDNMITRLLLWPHPLIRQDEFIDPAHDATLLEDVEARLGQLSHVGLVEDPEMATRLGEALGVGLVLPVRNEGVPPGTADPVDVRAEAEKAAEALAERSRIDHGVWSRLVARRLPGTAADELAVTTFERALSRYERMADQPRRPADSLGRRVARRGRTALSRRR
jgi:hypothetical protein